MAKTHSADNVPVTFVNLVLGRGVMHGVINVTFGVANFTPDSDEATVHPDIVVASRLRMDIPCARDLHQTLGTLLEELDRTPTPTPSMPPQALDGVVSGKPN